MTNDFIKQITEMNKTTAASVKALTDINTKAVKAMFEKQSEIFNTVLEARLHTQSPIIPDFP